MALTSRIRLEGPPASSPEDFFLASLGVIFEDDVTNQHGDDEHSLVYSSPHLPRPLRLDLAAPTAQEDRRLFSHYLWNSSLQLAELIEAGTLELPYESIGGCGHDGEDQGRGGRGQGQGLALATPVGDFDVRGLSTLELGAGTALPSILSALLGAKRTVVTDYPASVVMDTLRVNVKRNTASELSPHGCRATEDVTVESHAWGELDTPLALENKESFDRVLVCDCLWMPWQHENLHRSIAWFLGAGEGSRCWVVAGFHTGREKMQGFFADDALANVGLEVERIWERDCNGVERAWASDRGAEDVTVRKRWLVIAVLKRRRIGRQDRT